MTTATSHTDTLALDATDELAPYLDEFEPLPIEANGRELVYLDGNSLGRPPRRTARRTGGDRERRMGYEPDPLVGPLRRGTRSRSVARPAPACRQRLAPVIGALPGEVVVHDSTTVDLYQLVHAALRLRPDRRVIAVDPGDFPTDRYVVDGIAAATGHVVRHGFEHLDDVAVAVRSLVDYRTAELVDLAAETARAHAAGALVLWDLSRTAPAARSTSALRAPSSPSAAPTST